MAIENPYKVKLTSASKGGGRVTFAASPTVSENRNVNYGSLDPLHAPGQIQVYKNTSSRTFQISDIRLISRTIAEADANLKKLWMLRGWCLPRFGLNSTTLETEEYNARVGYNAQKGAGIKNPVQKDPNTGEDLSLGTELLGAPPPILYLSAYSKEVTSATKETRLGVSNVWTVSQHINRIPVVIQQLTIPYPNDVDYITTSTGVPMPIIMNIDLGLVETHSPNSYEGFNLNAFKQGILQGF